jgi:hypothetical protein
MKAILIAGIAITSAIPARAQDLPCQPQSKCPAATEGFRIAETSNGFQLVEHGLWRSAQAARHL